jgi:hypothetical protein
MTNIPRRATGAQDGFMILISAGGGVLTIVVQDNTLENGEFKRHEKT